jgi:hypothetical protein
VSWPSYVEVVSPSQGQHVVSARTPGKYPMTTSISPSAALAVIEPAAARGQIAALLPVRERLLGANHPPTTRARQEHTRWARLAVTPDP